MVQREALIILGAKVKVKLMGPLEEDRFLLLGVSPMTTGEDIKKFFSPASIDSQIQRVIFSRQHGVIMLQFAFPPPGEHHIPTLILYCNVFFLVAPFIKACSSTSPYQQPSPYQPHSCYRPPSPLVVVCLSYSPLYVDLLSRLQSYL